MRYFLSGKVELGASGLHLGLEEETVGGAIIGRKVPPDGWKGGFCW